MKKFKDILNELSACETATIWAKDMTIEEVVNICHRGDWLLWLASRINIDKRKLALTKGLCAKTVIHLMKDSRSIKAVNAAIDYGNNLILENELDAAYDAAAAAASAYAAAAAYDAAYDAAFAAAAAADAAYAAAAAYDAAAAAAYDAAYDAANAAYYAAYAAAAADAAYAAAKTKNQLETADICRGHIGQLIIDKINLMLND